MVLTKSSKVSYQKNSNVPLEFIKRSWKVPQCFEILRSTGLQKVRKRSKTSSRYQEYAQKDPNVRSPQVLKWSSNYSKCSQSPRIPQSSSKVLNRSTRSHQKFLNGSSMFWEHQDLRSSKSPQKVHKVLKKSRKCTNMTQGSLSPQVLNWPSTCPQIRQKVIKALEVLRGPQKVFKMASKSSKRSQRPQNPLVVKRSSKGHQMVLTKSSKVSYQKNSNVPQEVIKRYWKVLQCSESIRSSGLQKVRKSPQSPQDITNMHKRTPTSAALRSSNDPQITQKVLKFLEFIKGPQKILKSSSKSSKIYQRPQSPQ